MKKYYTYLLTDSISGQPFYVGKGTGPRMYQHLREAQSNTYTKRSVHYKILSILKEGGKVEYTKVEWDTEADAFNEERRLITMYGRKDLKTGVLCNLTDGGEGSSNSPDAVERRAAKHRGSKRSPESRARMKEAQLKIVAERVAATGEKRTTESRAKQSATSKGKPWSEKAKAVRREKPTATPVLVYKVGTNEFVGRWESLALCAKELNCELGSVWKVANGWMSKAPDGTMRPYKSHRGYTFRLDN